MSAGLLLALALAAAPARAASVKLFAYDEKGAPLKLAAFARLLARADEKPPQLDSLPFWAVPVDGETPAQRAVLTEDGDGIVAAWDKGDRVRFELVWPVEEDGYNAVAADKGGEGYRDGETLHLDEEIAATMYRRFRESWKRRLTDWQPLYKPGAKAKSLAAAAQTAMAKASAAKDLPARAKAFRKALHATALAWEKTLFEHGLQHALDERRAAGLRFGLTIDEGILKRLDDLEWIAEAIRRSGSDSARLVFRANPDDFAYASLRSFNEYDGVVEELEKNGIKVMGCVLDTAQWPRALTPELYAERVKNLVLHYKGRVTTWEVGSELNGDWLGGASDPLSPDEVFRIYTAGAAKVKELVPTAETVATLYAWEETAPSRAHALTGWLPVYAKKGFGTNLDLVGLTISPEDNPAGMGLERLFDAVADAMPAQRLMISSLGFVEKKELKGYWWLEPEDVDGGRKDIAILYATASCALPRSVCGGFWWQTLDQMLPPGRRKATDLYKVWRRTLEQLGRRDRKEKD